MIITYERLTVVAAMALRTAVQFYCQWWARKQAPHHVLIPRIDSTYWFHVLVPWDVSERAIAVAALPAGRATVAA